MRHGSRPAARLLAGALVLVLHVVVVWLLIGEREFRRRAAGEPQFVSLWLEAPVPPPEPPRTNPVAPRARTTQPRIVPVVPVATAIAPDRASPPAEAAPSIDWAREAAAVAGAHAKPDEAAAFGGKTLPEPRKQCKVKEWQWTPEPKKGGLLPLPYVVLGRCVVGLGFFGCAPGAPPETNTHQLDDYKRGEKAGPSVPDPNVCD